MNRVIGEIGHRDVGAAVIVEISDGSPRRCLA